MGSEEIEIVGTYVIPEFGTVAVLILIVAVGTIIMISAKKQANFSIQKYSFRCKSSNIHK